MFITENCVDPEFNDAYAFVSVDQVKQAPVPYRFVYGGFRGTDARFSFYFPLDNQYQGRFIQSVYPLGETDALASDTQIQQAFNDGAYLVATNNAGDQSCETARDCLNGKDPLTGGFYDPTVRGYRIGAAAAKFSREMAERIYNTTKRPYGYIFGGSGGAYMTVSSCEQTRGVWDGCLPFVFGMPDAIPDNMAVQVEALRVLNERGKFPCIMDAIDAGGSDDPVGSCQLDAAETQALMEATRLGFAPMAWYDWSTLNGGALPLVDDYISILDPTYVGDFWTKPGYLGTDPGPSGADVRAARVQYEATVVAAAGEGSVPGPVPPPPDPPYGAMGPLYDDYIVAQYVAGLPPNAFVLSGLPATDAGGGTPDLAGAWLVVESGPASGKHCNLNVLDASQNLVQCGPNSDPDVVKAINTGDRVRIDNSFYLALQTYQRHQVPLAGFQQVPDTGSNVISTSGDFDPDYYAWDQFVAADGKPIYPQRAVNTGLNASYQASGSIPTGRFNGKMIMLASRMDDQAFGWGSDWYRRKATEMYGAGYMNGNYRLYIDDHAVHNNTGTDANYIIDYSGLLEQGLRDLFAWVEKGTAPPASTNYSIGNYPFLPKDTVTQAQIQLPPTAAQRLGIQPVVQLSIQGGKVSPVSQAGLDGSYGGPDTITVHAGQSVTFSGSVTTPPGAGQVVCMNWTYEAPRYFQQSSTVPDPTSIAATNPTSTSGASSGCSAVTPATTVTQTTTHTYSSAGTYYCVLYGISQQSGDSSDTASQMQNLARVRVVVS